jgi:hypothetical protein
MSEVIKKLALINRSTSPAEYSFATLFIVYVISFIAVVPGEVVESALTCLRPKSLPMSQSSTEFPLVVRAIAPSIFAFSIRFPVYVVSLIEVPVYKTLNALAMLKEIEKLPFIECS